MEKNGVTQQYQALAGQAPKLPFMKSESFDINRYVVTKALDGLFYMLGPARERDTNQPGGTVDSTAEAGLRRQVRTSDMWSAYSRQGSPSLLEAAPFGGGKFFFALAGESICLVVLSRVVSSALPQSLPCLDLSLGRRFIDFSRNDGRLGQDRDAFGKDLYETPGDEEFLLACRSSMETNFASTQLGEQRSGPVKRLEVAGARRELDRVSGRVQQNPIGRDQANLELTGSRRSGSWHLYSSFALYLPSLCRLLHLLGRGNDVLNATFKVEGLLGDRIVFAFDNLLEGAHRVGNLDVGTGNSGKDFGDMEGLRQEALDFARAGDGDLVVLGELVDTKDGNDVLQILVPLQNPLDALCDVVMLLADDARAENARGGGKGIDGRVDTEFR